MITRYMRKTPILGFSNYIFQSENIHDIVDDKDNPKSDPNETGFQRLRNLFKSTQNEPINPRLVAIVQTAIGTFLMGGVYGGFKTSRATFIQFIENNEATQFRNHYDAKRQLSDKMFISLMNGFVKWGSKVSFFCTSFLVSYTAIAVYRNKDSLLFYPFGAMYAGALYKFPLGPKAMVSGGVIGGFFGSVYACIKLLLLKVTNITEEQLNEKKYQSKLARERVIAQGYKDIRNKEAEQKIMEIMMATKTR